MPSGVYIRKPFSELAKKNIGLAKLGEKNEAWKGDNVGNHALHDWIKDHLSKPELCEFCKKVPPRDLANISGIYNRELDNWRYLCVTCRRQYDGSYIRTPEIREKHKLAALNAWRKRKFEKEEEGT